MRFFGQNVNFCPSVYHLFLNCNDDGGKRPPKHSFFTSVVYSMSFLSVSSLSLKFPTEKPELITVLNILGLYFFLCLPKVLMRVKGETVAKIPGSSLFTFFHEDKCLEKSTSTNREGGNPGKWVTWLGNTKTSKVYTKGVERAPHGLYEKIEAASVVRGEEEHSNSLGLFTPHFYPRLLI